MHGQQRLVGSDHMLAVGNGKHDQILRDTVAANQFDDDVDFGSLETTAKASSVTRARRRLLCFG
jgi:hypothetical protein